MSHYLPLDAVMTTGDAVNARRQLDEHAEAVKQVAIADRLLLTKTDPADPVSVTALEAMSSRLNPGAPTITPMHGEVAPDRLFGAALFDRACKTPDVQACCARRGTSVKRMRMTKRRRRIMGVASARSA